MGAHLVINNNLHVIYIIALKTNLYKRTHKLFSVEGVRKKWKAVGEPGCETPTE